MRLHDALDKYKLVGHPDNPDAFIGKDKDGMRFYEIDENGIYPFPKTYFLFDGCILNKDTKESKDWDDYGTIVEKQYFSTIPNPTQDEIIYWKEVIRKMRIGDTSPIDKSFINPYE